MDFSGWIGRTESSSDTVTAAPIAALSATLDRDDAMPRSGDPVPLLWHWLYFLPRHRASELDVDGHLRRGTFLPPVTLARRMYAGGRVQVHRPIRVGDEIERVSRVADISQKDGRSGPLVFVKVRHEISSRDGLALVEDHDIVYRDAGRPEPPGSDTSGVGGRNGEPEWQREVRPDEVLLFRYSALTFNGYRIHYDRRFAVDVQGYPGLVVHAPLVATLLADLLRRHRPQAQISTFVFRAVRPLFDGRPFFVCGNPPDDRRFVRLWAREPNGAVAFEATASLGSNDESPVPDPRV